MPAFWRATSVHPRFLKNQHQHHRQNQLIEVHALNAVNSHTHELRSGVGPADVRQVRRKEIHARLDVHEDGALGVVELDCHFACLKRPCKFIFIQRLAVSL